MGVERDARAPSNGEGWGRRVSSTGLTFEDPGPHRKEKYSRESGKMR